MSVIMIKFLLDTNVVLKYYDNKYGLAQCDSLIEKVKK